MERVFASLVQGLLRWGVRVTVFAHPESFNDRLTDSPTHRLTDSPTHRLTDSPTHRLTDSPTERLLVQVPTYAPVGRLHPQAAEMRHTQVAARFISDVGTFDIIHDHTRLGAVDFAALDVPAVTTAHYDPTRDPMRWAREVAAGHPYVALSNAQMRSAPDVNWTGVIPNGIDQSFYRPGEDRFGYLVHIAALGPRKGTDLAIRIARAAGRQLVVIGSADRADPEGFAREVEPLLGDEHVTWLDEQSGDAKLPWLQGAAALLHPIRWDEPFGLVYVEALACGVPVLTLNRGAAPELVQHGVTGVVADQWTDLIDAARDPHRWSPQACRASVSHLTDDAMVEAYLNLYEQLIDRGTRPKPIPRQRRASLPISP
ncbi:glycosyltransferase [Catenulispora sp. NL8]|uniref:Glycosyltransferase n=1 Tax=Catenulispora pinistramenti TaxID=2705254 RepID=A0ABS5KWT5_9ACTN|nr:glycosyltransferase [Catenulispora pinistramenti]